MQCLEKYRSKMVRDSNRQLRVIAEIADESAVHDFRVGIKRLTAFYNFLAGAGENLSAKKLLKPYRVIFRQLGSIRDAQIAIGLLEEIAPSANSQSKPLVGILRSGIRRDYRRFRRLIGHHRLTVKLPTVRATGITSAAISRHKPVYLDGLLAQILSPPEKRMTADGWHRKRILLKRYRHLLEAFSLCPGQTANPRLLKHVSLLEQLLGDWHDRVITVEFLQSLPGATVDTASLIREMKKQERMLLGAAKIYLDKFAQAQQELDSTG